MHQHGSSRNTRPATPPARPTTTFSPYDDALRKVAPWLRTTPARRMVYRIRRFLSPGHSVTATFVNPRVAMAYLARVEADPPPRGYDIAAMARAEWLTVPKELLLERVTQYERRQAQAAKIAEREAERAAKGGAS